MSSIIRELKNARSPDDTSINKLVKKLYEDIFRIIKFKNKNGITKIIYEVPHVTVGFPLYEIKDVAYKLTKYLKSKGFKTTLYCNKIYINW
jgi:hypothetical protein